MLACVRTTRAGVALRLTVQPRARKTEIVGIHGETLKVRISAPPVDGAANDELISFFAGLFGTSSSRVRIQRGGHSRHKTVEIEGASEELALRILKTLGVVDGNL